MSEQSATLEEISRHLKGRVLLIGRRIGQTKFDVFKDAVRVEAKPAKYPTGANPIPWERGLLGKFSAGSFDSIVLHRFLYKPMKPYVEDPERVLTEVSRIMPDAGVLVVNSFLLSEKTESFRSADCFYTESEMMSLLQRPLAFTSPTRVSVSDTVFFVSKKRIGLGL
jgi:hypothetical protein